MGQNLVKICVRAGYVIALGFSFPTHAQVQPSLSFKGVEIGKSSGDDVVAKFDGAKKYGSMVIADAANSSDRSCTSEPCRQQYRIGQTSAGTFMFTEKDGKVGRLSAKFTTPSFPAVRAALEEKYGKPTSEGVDEVKTKVGATFSSRAARWVLPDGLVEVKERSGRMDEMSLTMTSNTFIEQSKEEAAKSAKDAAKNL